MLYNAIGTVCGLINQQLISRDEYKRGVKARSNQISTLQLYFSLDQLFSSLLSPVMFMIVLVVLGVFAAAAEGAALAEENNFVDGAMADSEGSYFGYQG